MKSTKWTRRGIAFAVGLTALVTGCQTAIPISYTEPAKFNMAGISKVGIVSGDSSVTAEVTNALTSTGKYTIASADEIKELSAWLRQQERLAGGIEANAADLVSEYDANEVRADQKYDKKIIKVTGTVSEFQRGAVRLGVGNNTVDVYIIKEEEDKVAALNKGDTITVVGSCSGLKSPESDGINEILSILGGGGKHVNIARASFFIPEYKGAVDAVLTVRSGGSTRIESEKSQVSRKLPDGRTVYESVENFTKHATFAMDYNLVGTRDGSVRGTGDATGTAKSSSTTDRTRIQDDSSLISEAKKQPIKKLISDLVPTQQTLSVKLLKSDSQDKDVKAAMSEANKFVKSKDYAAAADAYGKIYADSKDFAAGYNQAVLTEVADGTEPALALMEALAKVSDRQEVHAMLDEMQKRNSANKRAAEQLK